MPARSPRSMSTRRRSTVAGASRSSTPAARRQVEAGSRTSGPVRVWSSASVTVAVSDDPPQFVKFEHGFEMMSPNDTDAAIRRTEQKIYDTCEAVINRRLKKLRRLMRQIESEL